MDFVKKITKNTGEFIVKKYLDMMPQRGFGKFSVQSICQQCYISRQTFYHYFENISELEDAAIQFLLTIHEPPVTLQKVIIQLHQRRLYIKHFNTPHLHKRLHELLATVIAELDPVPSFGTDRSLLHTCLSHFIVDWLLEDGSQTPKQIIDLCTVLLQETDWDNLKVVNRSQ